MTVAIETQAAFGTVKFDALSYSGNRSRRIVEHPAWGRDGADTEDTGRGSQRDTVQAKVSLADFLKLQTLCDKAKVQTFTHPVFGSYKARINIPNRSGSGTEKGVVTTELEFVEEKGQPLAKPTQDETADSKFVETVNKYTSYTEARTENTFDDTTESNADDFEESWDTFNEQSSLALNEQTSTFRDLERSLDSLKSTGWAVVTSLGAYDGYQDGAAAIESAIIRCLNSAHDMTESFKQMGRQWYPLKVKAVTDIYSLASFLFDGDNHEAVEQIIARNDILDSMFIASGKRLEIPYL